MQRKWKWVLGGVAAAAVAGGAVLTAVAATPSADLPTTAELQANGTSFIPSNPPAGLISAQTALNDLLATNGGHWSKFPSSLHVERFGYLSNAQIRALSAAAVQTDPALAAGQGGTAGLAPAKVAGVPAWEITFGGLSLHAPGAASRQSPATADGTVWRNLTTFIDANTGQELWEMYNHCSPCVGPGPQ